MSDKEETSSEKSHLLTSEKIGSEKNERKEIDPKANLSDEQKEKLDKFKKELEPFLEQDWEKEWTSEMCCLRYLRARNFDLKKSQAMIRETIIWRRENRPDCITSDDVDIELKNSGKMYRGGRDKNGRPIVYLKPGWDNTGDKEKDVKIKYFIYVMEKASLAAEQVPGGEKLVWVVDPKDHKAGGGLSTGNGIKVAKEVINIVQNHYPERLGAAFIYNAPWLFQMFFKLISPFVDENTITKVNMVKDLTKNNPIMEISDPSEVEVDYGGTNTFKWDYQNDRNKEDLAFPPKTRETKKSE